MKFLLLLIGFVIFSNNSFSQFTTLVKGVSNYTRFNHSETYFVLSEREELANSMKQAVNEFWKITPIHFVTEEEFKTISKDRDKSFVYIHKVKRKGIKQEIKVLALVNGGDDGKTTYLGKLLAFISLDNNGYESNELDLMYRLPNLIHQLQDVVTIVKEENITGNSEVAVRNKLIKHYNKRIAPLKNKILLVDKRYLSQKISSEEEIVRNYKYEVLFVDRETIKQAVINKDSKFAYLVSSLNLYKINTVTDCETGNIIYASFSEEDKFTEEFDRTFSYEDIKNLSGHVKNGK